MPESRTQVEQASTKAAMPSRPGIPPSLRSYSPLGSASEMQRDPLGFMMRAHRLGDVVHMRFVSTNAYLIYHPDDVKHVLQENHRNYNKDLVLVSRSIEQVFMFS